MSSVDMITPTEPNVSYQRPHRQPDEGEEMRQKENY